MAGRPEICPWGPSHIGFMIGDKCNANCLMCWQSRRRRDGLQREGFWPWPDLPAGVVYAVMRQFGGSLRSTEFVSFGEPMLHPGFAKMLDVVARHHDLYRMLSVSIITNGSLLERYADPLVRIPGMITVSIYSPDRATYKTIRRGLDLDRVLASCAAAIGHPARHPDRRFCINMTVGRYNAGQIADMADFAKSNGFDALAVIIGGAMESTDAAGQAVDPDDPQVRESMAEARRRQPSLDIIDYFTTAARSTEPCPAPWMGYDIDPRGRAHPCCRSYDTDLGPWDSSPWNGPTMRELRHGLVAKSLDASKFPACLRCERRGW
jgi:MoaA/NifB/PqqE/SkfB family radical SAM enzyme